MTRPLCEAVPFTIMRQACPTCALMSLTFSYQSECVSRTLLDTAVE